jgi:hypothetical protein
MDQPDEGADGLAGEPAPVADLDRQREPGNAPIPRRQPSRCTSGVNSLSAAIWAIAASSRSRRALTTSTAS